MRNINKKIKLFRRSLVILGLLSLNINYVFALESSSYLLQQEFPNYADRIAKESSTYKINEDGMTWYRSPLASTSFQLVTSYQSPEVITPPDIPPIVTDGGSTGSSGGGSGHCIAGYTCPGNKPIITPEKKPNPPAIKPNEPIHSAPSSEPQKVVIITKLSPSKVEKTPINIEDELEFGDAFRFSVLQRWPKLNEKQSITCNTNTCANICWILMVLILLVVCLQIWTIYKVSNIKTLVKKIIKNDNKVVSFCSRTIV